MRRPGQGIVYMRNLTYATPGAPDLEFAVFLRAAGPNMIVYFTPYR